MNEQTINMILQLAEQGGSMALWGFIIHEFISLLEIVCVIGGLGWIIPHVMRGVTEMVKKLS